MTTKREMLPPAALTVLRSHQAKIGPDLAAVVEAAFRLGHYMGKATMANVMESAGKKSKVLK